ncbi:PAS domain-containing sensor histidine kinase [Marivirga salinae]|uniref:histidine kinase n=1 Tax=Marivirga salinarum TaxID=3059078 RepID=A0AA51REF6_9BACT|nr:PAS domain-containing sensor histidine kinase [Marivirga sp. BDSF4-3]WMN12389.1 PAS domain-containing sensor histidine kinase [Marivirga sp. BDSF4-3]
MGDTKPSYEELERELVRLKSDLKTAHQKGNEDKQTSFQLFYENSSDALLITSPDGGIHTVNPAGCKLFGWSEEEICKGGRNLLVDLTDKSLPEALKKRQKSGYVEGELIFKKKDGTRFIGEYSSKIFTNSTGLLRTSMIVRDITDRKKAESLLKDKQRKLKELNTTKDKLFSIVAHDLRGPFNNLKGLAELIITRLAQNNIEKAQEYAGLIASSAKRSLTLLENLLQWAQAQTGDLSFRPEKIILSEIIKDIIELKRPLLVPKNISINYKPSHELIVYADNNMFRLVMRNLISNSIKFTDAGGYINIKTDHKDDYVEISVSDTGVGMNKKQIRNLFDITKISTSLGTAGEKGSGLGLVICKEFVDRHGGEIWATSEEGVGTEFTVRFPLSQ